LPGAIWSVCAPAASFAARRGDRDRRDVPDAALARLHHRRRGLVLARRLKDPARFEITLFDLNLLKEAQR
jgi:hypothetical protein